MSAPVLTVEQVAAWGVEAASDRLGAFDWNGRFVALADSHEALRAERDELAAKLEAVIAPIEAGGGYAAQMRAERDELQQECNDAAERLRWGVEEIGKVRAERDAALAEVARLKASIMVWYDQLTTRDLGAIQGEMREAVSPTAPITAADIRRAMAAIASDPEVQP